MARSALTRPEVPTSDDNRHIEPVDEEIFWENIRSYIKKKDIIEEEIYKSYSLVMGQCRKVVQDKSEGMPVHPKIFESGNTILLLENINTAIFNFQSIEYLTHTIQY